MKTLRVVSVCVSPGTQHARMLIRVIVHPPGEFEKWVEAQQREAANDVQVKAGRDTFLSTSCVNCHTIRGTEANGKFGPDLTHLMSRETLGSGASQVPVPARLVSCSRVSM